MQTLKRSLSDYLWRTAITLSTLLLSYSVVTAQGSALDHYIFRAPLAAQEYPFDSAVYFPEVGVPGEVEVRVGTRPGFNLGWFIKNVGRAPGRSNDRIWLGGFEEDKEVTEFEDGTSFTLKNFSLKDLPFFRDDPTELAFQSLHNPEVNDLVHFFRIYWAMQNGEFDTNDYTDPETHLEAPFGTFPSGQPFFVDANEDGITDLVLLWRQSYPDADSTYLLLYYGGPKLRSAKVAYPDSTLFIASYPVNRNRILHGDFRGVGRDDILSMNGTGDLFHYKNDPPFDLQRFANSLLRDTLLSHSENKTASYDFLWNSIAMRAFTKKRGDHSVDLVAPIAVTNENNAFRKIRMFRGGPDFGKKRLYVDSADFVLRAPAYLNSSFETVSWGGAITNCGDMTGTGNNVVFVPGGEFDVRYYFFYVLGEAMDEKADMTYFLDGRTSPGGIDTLHAGQDGLTDLLYGESGNDARGALYLVHGSNKIPVIPNPQFASVKHNSEQLSYCLSVRQTGSELMLSIRDQIPGPITIQIYDILGQLVLSESAYLESPSGAERIDVSSLSSGSYTLSLATLSGSIREQVSILK